MKDRNRFAKNSILLIAFTLMAVMMAAMLCGCTSKASPDSEEAASDADNIDYTTGTPWLAADVDGNVTADTRTDVKDNYALYANKDDLLKLELSEDIPYNGTVLQVVMSNDEEIKALFTGGEPESHDAKLAYDLYQLMMDWDSRNAVGVAPLKEKVDVVEMLDSVDAVSEYMLTVPVYERLYEVWSCTSTEDLDDSSKHVLSAGNCGMLLGDSAEYKEELTDEGKTYKDASKELSTKMLKKLGYTEAQAEEKFNNCLAFEEMFASSLMTRREKSKSDRFSKINNHFTRDEVLKLQGKIPVVETFEQNMGYPETDDYVIAETAFFEKLNEIYTDDNLQLIKDYMIVHGVINAAYLLDRECYEWHNDYTNALDGVTGIPDDEDAFSAAVSSMLNWAVGRLYAEKYLREEDKVRISAMVDEIMAEYHEIIEEADWLSEETREKALEKLDAINKNVLYPDDWEKYGYEGLDFKSAEDGGTLLEADRNIQAFIYEQDLKEFSEPVDKERWGYARPQIVNCFYEPTLNSISIMGAYARGNVYNNEMSDEELYGKLGTTIAHEITHAFDSSGAQFDKNGDFANWWTEEDLETFNKKNEKLAEYFNNIHPWEGQDLDGEIMTGEACADMAGMKCILRIVAEKDDFDYDKFFRAFANMWLYKESPQSAQMSVDNEHPMYYLRINTTLQQCDEFLDFYGIKEGDNMYLAPEDRVNVW